MPEPSEYSFTRYLAAKKSLDDRSINRPVWQALKTGLPGAAMSGPLQVLEIGAGIGTMIERILEWELVSQAEITILDALVENIETAQEHLWHWAERHDLQVTWEAGGWMILQDECRRVRVNFVTADLFDFIDQRDPDQSWGLLIGHAFLDLLDLPATLPKILSLLRPGGYFYFSLNFDGLTLFEPELDPALDEQIQALYHRAMDERLVNGKPSGDSRTGRRLFNHLKATGARVLAAGSSDWVIFPGPSGYFGDEAYFLHFIIHTVATALYGHPELDVDRFIAWVKERHAQVERGELVYIAHQLDFYGAC